MKKFAIIFIIAIVAMGTVFADTAKIKVSTDISEKNPTFQLEATAVASISNGATSTVEATPTEGSVTVKTDTLLENDVAITFNINQTTMSRTTQNYTLSITATDLKMVKDGDNNTTGITITDNRKFVVTVSEVTAKTVAGVTLAKGTGDSITADYNGAKITANQLLGTFKCTWAKNANAEVGSYEATVTLTVATA